jgi:hypothetical protein
MLSNSAYDGAPFLIETVTVRATEQALAPRTMENSIFTMLAPF